MHISVAQAAKVVALLVAVTACTSPSTTDTDHSPSSIAPTAQSQEGTEPPSTSTGQPTSPADVTATNAVDPSNAVIAQPAAPPSILQTVRLSDDDWALVYETAQVGTAACMSDIGYDYEWPTYEELNPDGPNMAVTESDARQYGYRRLPSSADTPPLSPADLRAQGDESYRRALTGEPEQPDDGCNGIAHTRAYDDQGIYAELNQLIEPSSTRVSTRVSKSTSPTSTQPSTKSGQRVWPTAGSSTTAHRNRCHDSWAAAVP